MTGQTVILLGINDFEQMFDHIVRHREDSFVIPIDRKRFMTTATQPAGTEKYVSFSADINPTTAEVLIQVMSNLANQGVSKVSLLLSTGGGSVMHGMNIYNVLKALPFELHIYNVGNIDSIGNVIFQAGSKRFASPQSTFLFHGVGAPPTTDFTTELALTERLNGVKADQERITEILESRTTMPHAEIDDLFLRSKTKNAPQALSDGIVDEIKDPQVPTGVEVIALAFPR